MELFEFYKKIEEYQNQKNNILATVLEGKTAEAAISFQRETLSQCTVTVRSRMNN